MSDRHVSKRSKRRLRSKVALLVAQKVPHTRDQPPRGRSPSPSVGSSSSNYSPSLSVCPESFSMSDLSPSASATGFLSNQSPSPSVHAMSSDRSLSASDEDCLRSIREVDYDSEVRSSNDLCGDVASKEGSI